MGTSRCLRNLQGSGTEGSVVPVNWVKLGPRTWLKPGREGERSRCGLGGCGVSQDALRTPAAGSRQEHVGLTKGAPGLPWWSSS